MTIHKIKGEIAFSCDECPDTLDTGERVFSRALSMANEEGWASALWGGQYVHHCPTCAKKMGTA